MSGTMEVLAASYPSQQLAERDWAALRALVDDKALPLDDLAVLVKDEHGHVGVVKDLHHPVRKGLIVGALLAAVTPVGLIAGALAGAFGGKLTDIFRPGITKGTMKDLADFVEANTVLIVMTGEPAVVEAAKVTLADATGMVTKTIDTDPEAVRAAADEGDGA